VATMDLLRELQADVGTRRAGTPGEKRAQEWLQRKCEQLGLAIELDEFTFIGSERYGSLLMLISLLWGAASITLSFDGEPLLGLLGFALLLIFHTYFRKRIELRLAREGSHNVIAGLPRSISDYVQDPAKGPAVLLCAHYDTPRNLPRWYHRVTDVMRITGPLAILGILVYIAFMGLRALGWLLASAGVVEVNSLLQAVEPWMGYVVLLLAGPFALLRIVFSAYGLVRRKSDSQGADDNGSGTAVVLELAGRLKRAKLQNMEVFFAWWGAEERGLFGSRQFARRFGDQLDRELLHLINIDCVGVCEYVTVHTGQGVIRRRSTNPATVARIEDVAKKLGVKTIRAWESIISGGSSDHAGWMDRGFSNTVSLLREDYRPLPLPGKMVATLLRIPDANMLDLNHVHTEKDTIDNIKVEVLEQTTDMAEAYVRTLDALYDAD